MRRINLFFIIFFVIIMSGCGNETNADMPLVADEIAELEAISIETARETFYDVSLGNDNSPVAKVTANSFESSGTFRYVDKVDDEWYIGYVVLKDDIYYDIMKNSENKITVERYNKLNITESDIELNDNINRIGKTYSLQNDNQTKDLFTLTRNITPSSYIDVLKQCKGKTNLNEDDKKAYDIPQNIFAKYYNENGLNIDFKYLINDETGFKVCAIEIIPEGYCLTVYEPVRDWFEVTIYPYLVCIETGDLKQYYLSDEADGVGENHFFICEINKSNVASEYMSLYGGNVQFVDNMLSLLPKDRSVIYYSQNADVELAMYCNDTEMFRNDTESTYTHLNVNGEEYVLDSFGKSFYLREAVIPKVFWCDFNKDGVTDFIIECACDRFGCLQYAFASKENGSYKNLGSVCWDTNGVGNVSYDKFPYEITLIDDYRVNIRLESAGINERYDLSQNEGDFLNYCAIPLGLYDKDGKVTEVGRTWDFTSLGLYESDFTHRADEDMGFIMSVKSYINAGYSTVNIGCGFVFEWNITGDGYKLSGIKTFTD